MHGIRRLLEGGGEASLEGKQLLLHAVVPLGSIRWTCADMTLCGGAVAGPLEPALLSPCACSACEAAELCSPFPSTDPGNWGHSSSPPPPHVDPRWFTNQKGTLLVCREAHSDIRQ